MHKQFISLIVPTRGRPQLLQRFLASIAITSLRPQQLEIVLVIDDDDPESLAIDHPRLNLVRVVGPPGRTMGALNTAGYEASTGNWLMLLNDDVVARTRGWDVFIRRCLQRYPDPFVLIHVNDLLMQRHLCVFPLISRAYCCLAGGICPIDYQRYRIDDHIEDPFNMLAAVGVKRTMFLPDVIFEHDNVVVHPDAGRVYMSDPAILDLDAPRFEALFTERKQLALRMLELIGQATPHRIAHLQAVSNSFALRSEQRQLVVRMAWWKRVQNRFAHHGCRGVAHALCRRITAFRV